MSVECSDDRRTYPWCRVCLTSNVRMCSIANNRLREIYEKLTSTQVDHDQGIPQVICFICYSLLRRAHRFSEMAHRSQTILEDLRQQGVEAHQIDVMPDFGIQLTLSVTDYCTIISVPKCSNNQNACDLEIVSELQNTVDQVQTVSDEEFMLEEIHSTPEDEIYDDHRDPTHTVPCNEVPILDNLLSKDEIPSSVTDNPVIINEVVHVMKDNEHDLHNKHIKRTPFVQNKTLIEGGPFEHPIKAHIGENRLKCGICNKSYTLNSSLKVHIRTHTGEKPYECTICRKTFSRSSVLKKHIRTHTGEKAYKCHMCNKGFTQRPQLKNHLRIHTGEKPYECKICKKCFPYLGSLQYHIGTHTKEKPYECDICTKKFSLKVQLRSHIRTHKDKLYNCIMCSKTFSREIYLKQHVRTHTRVKTYKCKMCNKVFVQEAKLQLHLTTHNREKLHKCEICNKIFARKYILQLHIRTHVGENSYKCNMCNEIFSRQYHLKQHIRTHTSEKHSIAN